MATQRTATNDVVQETGAAPAAADQQPTAHPGRRRWARERTTLYSLRGITRLWRMGIWLRGRLDGRRGQVVVDENGCVSSPYCTELVQAANRKLDAEWLQCDGDVLPSRQFLDQLLIESERLNRELESLDAARDAAVRSARTRQYEGDAHVSAATAAARQERREAKAAAPFAARRAELTEALDSIAIKAAEELAAYEEREGIAANHELVVRHELDEMAAIYARGASKYTERALGYVHAASPDTAPRENHLERYKRYRFDAHRSETNR